MLWAIQSPPKAITIKQKLLPVLKHYFKWLLFNNRCWLYNTDVSRPKRTLPLKQKSCAVINEATNGLGAKLSSSLSIHFYPPLKRKCAHLSVYYSLVMGSLVGCDRGSPAVISADNSGTLSSRSLRAWRNNFSRPG